MVGASTARPLRLVALVGGLALALLLAGCIEISTESEFDSDGSARHSLAMLVDRSLADDPTFGEDLDFDEMEQEARDAGFEAEPVETDEQVGVRISRDVADNEDLGAVLNDLFSSFDAEAPSTDAFSGSFTTSEGGFGRATTHTLTITVNADTMFEDDGEPIDEDLDFPPEMMRQFFTITYTAVMPGEVVDHNGRLSGTNRVQWDIPFEGVQTFQATSEEEGGIGLLVLAGVAIGALAILLVAIVGILIMSQRRRSVEPVPSESPPATTEPGPPPSSDPPGPSA